MTQLKKTTGKSAIDPNEIAMQAKGITGSAIQTKKVIPKVKINVMLLKPYHMKLKAYATFEEFNIQDKVAELIIQWLDKKPDVG